MLKNQYALTLSNPPCLFSY